jgi:hypothetical protein
MERIIKGVANEVIEKILREMKNGLMENVLNARLIQT